MRALALTLLLLLVLIQYPLWLGKGGWLRVWELDRQLQAQISHNAQQRVRNLSLEGEVRDLKEGLVAIEERARYELGMIKPDEIFVQIGEPGAPPAAQPVPSGVLFARPGPQPLGVPPGGFGAQPVAASGPAAPAPRAPVSASPMKTAPAAR